jgi:hypothetical protein
MVFCKPVDMPHVHTGVTSHSARYLLALCCIQLGKLNDARDALTKMGDREVRRVQCTRECGTL